MSSFDSPRQVARAKPGSTAPGFARATKVATKRTARRTQAERTDETRTRVLDAAAIVLRRKGYAGLRTDEVARVAKVSRGAMQYHFRTKDSLVLATAETLMRDSLERGQRRANEARAGGDPIEAIIQDCIDFFLGPDFATTLDLVLAGSKDRALRDKIYGYTRESRLAVENAWLRVLVERGLPEKKAKKLLWLTISIVRGLSVRALWQRDDALFRELLDEWKLILAGHLESLNKETTR